MVKISKGKESKVVNSNDFSSLCLCAIRYCIGRRTYMPATIISVVTPLLPFLDLKTLSVIQKDIDVAPSLGDENIDKPLWLSFGEKVAREFLSRKAEKESK